MNNKILDSKTYKNIICWKYAEGWHIDSFADATGNIYPTFNKCKEVINKAIENGDIIS